MQKLHGFLLCLCCISLAYIDSCALLANATPTHPSPLLTHSPPKGETIYEPEYRSSISRVLHLLYPSYLQLVSTRHSECEESLLTKTTEQALTLLPPTGIWKRISIIILHDHVPNAYVLPCAQANQTTAQILLTRGLLRTADTKDQLAFVLAHEMEHIEQDHFCPDFPSALFTSRQLTILSDLRTNWEFHADRLAVERMTAAGFNPHAALILLVKLSLSKPAITSPSPSLSTHPGIASRLSALGTHPCLSKYDNRRSQSD